MKDLVIAKKIFELVRDIPYKIPLEKNEPNNSCHGKSELLNKLLSSHGFESRIRVCSFYWNTILASNELKKLIVKDLEYHTFVELKINNDWIILDPSFDNGLKSKFPINEWSIKGTKLALNPKKIFDSKETEKIMQKEIYGKDAINNMKKNKKLYEELNKRYKRIRIKNI